MTAEVGKRYRLKANFGNPAGDLHLKQGDEATVVALVGEDRQDPSAGAPTGVIVEIEDSVIGKRGWGIGLAEFDDHFEEVG